MSSYILLLGCSLCTVTLDEGVSDGFDVKEGIVFSEVEGRELKLDAYVPKSGGDHPAVLVVHGGAWKSGTRKQLKGYCVALADRGFVCFAIEYRLAPNHKFPAQIDDCRAAVRWIRRNGSEYKADASRLGAIGYSAGGHLVSLLATTGEAPTAANGDDDTRLSAVVAGGAPTDFRWFPDNGKWAEYWMGGDLQAVPEKFAAASAVRFVDKDDPPIFFFNGTNDQIVPLVWTMPLHQALKSKGVKTELHKVEGAGHMQAAADKEALTKCYQFLANELKPADVSSEQSDLQECTTNTDASFRAIDVSNDGTVIVGGTNGTLIRSIDDGKTWSTLSAGPETTELDFRDVEALADGSWVLMSAGTGSASNLFRSTDHGDTWTRTYANTATEAFFNGIAFWSNGRGLAIGDPIDGRLFLLRTEDFGKSWSPIDGPNLEEGEYGFAASGTGIVTLDDGKAWVATGAGDSRVLRTSDFGNSWQAAATGIRHGTQGSGVFSVTFSDTNGVAVGGDYQTPEASERNCAVTTDGGRTWTVVSQAMPHKACVRFLGDQDVLAVGRTGIMKSGNNGRTWKVMGTQSYYTFEIAPDSRTAYLAGANGRVAVWRLNQQ